MTRLILCAALFVSACSALRFEEREFEYADGGRATYFVIDKASPPSTPAASSYFFVISGSDCASLKRWMPQYFEGLESDAAPLRIFAIQKRGIRSESSPSSSCSETFTRFDHPRRWIADYSAFIRSKIAEGGSVQRVVLVGVSEGAEVVPVLAAQIPQVTHLVLLGSGAMDPYESFALQAKRERYEKVDEVLAFAKGPAPDDPDAPRDELAGRSWRYWSELKELRPTSTLLSLEIPVFVAMGDADSSMPVEALRSLEREFKARGKTSLAVAVYPGADHGLYDQCLGINFLPDFWRRVDAWSSID